MHSPRPNGLLRSQVASGISLACALFSSLSHVSVHDCGIAGVVISGNGTKGRLEGCDIVNQKAGVQIESGADPLLLANTIHDIDGVGVGILGSGTKGRLERNDVWGNTGSGLSIEHGADPNVTSNTIHAGKSAGVAVLDDSTKGFFARNRVFGNSTFGFVVSEGAEPFIFRNRVHANGLANIVFGARARGRLASNAIYGSETGVMIQTEAVPLVESNAIYSNEQVWICRSSSGVHSALCSFFLFSRK